MTIGLETIEKSGFKKIGEVVPVPSPFFPC